MLMRLSSTNHTAALTCLPIFNFPGTSGSLLAFSGYRYRRFCLQLLGRFCCVRIPCPGLSGDCSDRNDHLWVMFQQRAQGSGRRSVTNKMDSIKNQFHSRCRNERTTEERQFNSPLKGGGLEEKRTLKEIFTLLLHKKSCHLKIFYF